MNGYQGQLLASDQPNKCFKKNEELFFKIRNQCLVPIDYIQSIGVQGSYGTEFFLNHELIKIGQYGFIQFNDVKITSIKFNQDTDSSIKIDYIIHEK